MAAAAADFYKAGDGQVARLHFDGDLIEPSRDTPLSLDMEDGDVIDVSLGPAPSAPPPPSSEAVAVIVTVRRNLNMRQTKKYKLSIFDPLVKIVQAHKKHYRSCKLEPRIFWRGEDVGGRTVGEIGYLEGEWVEVMDNGREP